MHYFLQSCKIMQIIEPGMKAVREILLDMIYSISKLIQSKLNKYIQLYLQLLNHYNCIL